MSTGIFQKKSFSLATMLIALIMLVVSVWNFAIYFSELRGKTQEQIKFQRAKIEMAMLQLPKFFKKDFEGVALDFIEAGKTNNYFDFFLVKKNGRNLLNSSNLSNLNTDTFTEGALHQEIVTPDLTFYVSKKTMGAYEVTLGYFPVNNHVFTPTNIYKLIKADILDSIVFIIAIVLIGLRGFFQQIKFIRSGKLEALENYAVSTTEGKLIKDLFLHATSLTKKSVDLNIPDGIEVELARGTSTGVSFRAGMIRIDLNDYTALCTKHGANTINTMLSPIFSDFREMAERYSFYEVDDVGDERVFYSRAEDPEEARDRALSAIRGMFDIGKFFGNELTFKAAFAIDDLFLSKEQGKHKIKGSAFTYSQRYLSAFKDHPVKDFVISLSSRNLDGLGRLVENHTEEVCDLKGLGPHKLAFVGGLKAKPTDKEEIKYFLSNREIMETLLALKKSWNEDVFWALSEGLSNFKSHLKDPEHEGLLLALLQSKSNKAGSEKVVASLLMLFSKLLQQKNVRQSTAEVLTSYLHYENTRIQANALETLGLLGVYSAEAREFLKSSEGRIKANALIVLARNNLGPEVRQGIKDLLISDQENLILSGLYATTQIFNYHENHDLTLLKTAAFFSDTFSLVVQLAQNTRLSALAKGRAEELHASYGVYFS